MELLITVKPIRIRGEILSPGKMFRVAEDQGLVDRGYARRLTTQEARALLDTYVEEAKRVFAVPDRKTHYEQERLL